MCVIIDMNTLPAVFNSSDKKHAQFVPLLNHVNSRKSKITIGGSSYSAEIEKMPGLTKILAEMRRSKKLVIADSSKVDLLERQIAVKYPLAKFPDFNDKHIVALAAVTNAKVVCTIDKPLQKYLKQKTFYDKSSLRPKIYNEKTRASVLPNGQFKPTCKLC